MEQDFTAYYLADAAVSTQMEKADLRERWWFNQEGFLARDQEKAGSEYRDVDVLTYTKQKFTDFELTFTYQQTYNLTGIIIGTEAGAFPLKATEQGLEATGGVMLFLEAESHATAMGALENGYTNITQVRRRMEETHP